MAARIIGDDWVLNAFANLRSQFEVGGWRYADEITESYKNQIIEVDAIDTGRYLNSIEWLEVLLDEGSKYLISSASDPFVYYEGFVEFPTKQRYGGRREGKYPARRGILYADIEGVTDELIRFSFL